MDESGNPISNAVVQTEYEFDGSASKVFNWMMHTDVDDSDHSITLKHAATK